MTNHPNRRTRITTDSNGDVTVEYDCPWTDERISVTYFVPVKGGYVRKRDERRTYPQVCEGLSSRGVTLMATRENLADVIRKELRRSIARAKRELAL